MRRKGSTSTSTPNPALGREAKKRQRSSGAASGSLAQTSRVKTSVPVATARVAGLMSTATIAALLVDVTSRTTLSYRRGACQRPGRDGFSPQAIEAVRQAGYFSAVRVGGGEAMQEFINNLGATMSSVRIANVDVEGLPVYPEHRYRQDA